MENDWTYVPFVRYFLRTLLECYIDLDTRFAVVGDRRMSKGDRVAAMLENSLGRCRSGRSVSRCRT